MILRFWQFLRGWVTVEASGFSLERFLNMAAYHGVYIWDVVRTETGVRLCVSAKGFKMLKDSMRKTKSKLKITGKHGLPFMLFKYRHRKILIGGVIFFIAALYALSSFVWRVEVAGAERIKTEAIIDFCKTQGMYTGAYKGNFKAKEIVAALRKNFPDIGWADVHIRGTRALISLTETIPKKPVIDRKTPCDIVATKDGLITAIVTGAGKPLVKRGDVVKQGEVLVSGTVPLDVTAGGQVPEKTYVHAYAEVWARRYTSIKFSVPLVYDEKEYTGRKKTGHELQLLFLNGKTVSAGNSSVPFESYDKMTKRFQPGVSGDYPLPFILVTHTYREFELKQKARSVAEAAALAERMLTGRILREFDFSADITDKQVKYTETPDELIVDALIVTNERIDSAVPVNMTAPPSGSASPVYLLLPDNGDDYPVE